MDQRPEKIAAATNGLLVLFSPLILFAAVSLLRSPSNNQAGVTAGAYGFNSVLKLAWPALMMANLALLAGWRTWVHAQQRRKDGVGNWRGVGEAGMCGLAVPLAFLAPGILMNPLQAPPYVIAYGGVGLGRVDRQRANSNAGGLERHDAAALQCFSTLREVGNQ